MKRHGRKLRPIIATLLALTSTVGVASAAFASSDSDATVDTTGEMMSQPDMGRMHGEMMSRPEMGRMHGEMMSQPDMGEMTSRPEMGRMHGEMMSQPDMGRMHD